MRKFIYSNYTKFAAFVLCALFAALSAYLISSNFLHGDRTFYLEGSFGQSNYASNIVSREMAQLSDKLYETRDENGIFHPSKIKDMPPREQWEIYMATPGGETYTNAESDYSDPMTDEDVPYQIRTYGSYESRSKSCDVHVKMGEKTIEEHRVIWETIRDQADGAINKVIILLLLAAGLFIYLICVTGKKDGDKEIHMMLVDKVFVEITIFIALNVIFFGLWFALCIGVYLAVVDNIPAVNNILSFTVFAIVSVAMLLILSLVRNAKNGTFLKRSAVFCVCGWCLRILKKIWSKIKGGLREAKCTVLAASARNFGGRFVGIMMIVFALGVFILSWLAAESFICLALLTVFMIASVTAAGKRLVGFERVKEGIEKIKDGDLNYKIEESPDGVIGDMARNINSIGDGLIKSLEREIKAERMKSELITNVSHDLKTPLTSIINYADLLTKENLTPPEANDYAAIIKQKGEKLKRLTNDLFDISKAQSGNEEFNIEDIDICLLINQAMAELDVQIKESGLQFMVSSSEKEVFVKADGRKMSRVFENLFVNCVKYAMKNTRVYIDILTDDKGVTVEIKNIAGYEMNFDETEIAERFVRGDSARSTEGSGLGLAIVKSYVMGCGGAVSIKKDGDLFKVILNLKNV